MVLLSASP
jgi:hypothetical protein